MSQQEVWDVEERLRQVTGETTDLQQPKDLIAATLLFLHFAIPILGAIKATHDVAKIIYDFLHSTEKGQINAQGKNKVVIIKKGKRIELYNLSPEEIEKVLEQ